MTKPKPLTGWQEEVTPASLPRHIRRSIGEGPDGCWIWLRSKSRDGYGWTSLDNKTYQAHRLIYEIVKGEVAPGLVIDHLCRVRHCVNPDHMEPVTPHENLRRSELTPTGMVRCKNGHHFTILGKQRRCPVCLREYLENTRPGRREYIAKWRKRSAVKNAARG